MFEAVELAESQADGAEPSRSASSASAERRESMRVLVIDNYDSFTYNLVQYLGELGAEVEVVRNDKATVAELLERRPDRLVISPGAVHPGRRRDLDRGLARLPRGAGSRRSASASATRRWSRRSAGGRSAASPIHGKDAEIEHDGAGLFAGPAEPAARPAATTR